MFTPSERLIFPYFDGAKDRFGDPVAIERRFTLACGGDWAQAVRTALPETQPEDPAAQMTILPAVDRLFDAVRSAFEMVPFNPEDGTGAMDDHVYEALRAFTEFTVKKKNFGVKSPTSPPSCTSTSP